MPDAREKLLLRLPPDLKAWLRAEAEKNRRSLNSEVLVRLEESHKQANQQGDQP